MNRGMSIAAIALSAAVFATACAVAPDAKLAGEGTAVLPLEGTDWVLVSLDGEAVVPAGDQPRPSLLLDATERRVSGSDGCNRIMASYQRDGERIKFGQVASTMMACPQGMETARRYTGSLPSAASWKVVGRQLELYDAAGALLAGFEARETP